MEACNSKKIDNSCAKLQIVCLTTTITESQKYNI